MVQNPSITKCVTLLCLLAAASLVYAEWRDPFSLRPQVADFGSGVGNAVRLPTEAPKIRRRWFWSPIEEGRPPTESPYRIVINLTTRQVQLYEQQTVLKAYDVAIGQDEWETPTGNFAVLQMQENPAWEHPITGEVVEAGPENPLGTHWIGFWQEDGTQIGLHGTNQEDLIGQAVSHGCVRMRNSDISDLYQYASVGIPVEVIAL
ncbi:MAG: L,D-transpeptidase [Cyanobacteria bacterium P01_A01_bin.105]